MWIAITGTYGWAPLALSVAVLTWVAGFDVLYSLQDADFDRAAGLRSVPVRFGIVGALWISAGLHVVTVVALAALPWLAPLGWPYWIGLALILGVLAWEHAIVTPTDLSRIDKAFFDLNGYVSVVFFAFVALGWWAG